MSKWKFDPTKAILLREAKGFTQQDMANLIGTTKQRYSQLEKAGTHWSLTTLFRVCDALDTRPHVFLVEKEPTV